MTDDALKNRLDQLVGYGRPPKATQFRKGQSGNPKGRPRNDRKSESTDGDDASLAVNKAFLELGSREFAVKSGNTTATMTGAQALVHAQVQSALKGNALAQRDALRSLDQAERSKRAKEDNDRASGETTRRRLGW